MPTYTQDNKFLDFNLPQDAYVAFDATTLKDFIVQRLNENEMYDNWKSDSCTKWNCLAFDEYEFSNS